MLYIYAPSLQFCRHIHQSNSCLLCVQRSVRLCGNYMGFTSEHKPFTTLQPIMGNNNNIIVVVIILEIVRRRL